MKKLSDYSPEQVAKFNTMRKVLTEINIRYAQEGVQSEFVPYTKEEIAEYSRYCQLALRDRLDSHPENKE